MTNFRTELITENVINSTLIRDLYTGTQMIHFGIPANFVLREYRRKISHIYIIIICNITAKIRKISYATQNKILLFFCLRTTRQMTRALLKYDVYTMSP